MTEQALSDVKVVDLTWYVAGPYCTKLLADYGADVIKIERTGEGDPARRMGPFFKDDPHPDKSGLFLHLNTNKKGITLNLKSATGKKIFLELVRDADILVESFRPGVMERLGFSFAALEKINPKLVMTSLSNFGQTGPYRDFRSSDLITFAMGGAMHTTGTPDREPVAVARNIKMHECGWVAAAGTLAAWYGAAEDGIGEHVDVSLFEAQLGSTDRRDTQLLAYAYTGYSSPRQGFTARRSFLPTGFLPAKDGWVMTAVLPQDFAKYANAIERPEILQDPRFQNVFDVSVAPDMDGIFLEWLGERGKQEASEYLQDRGVMSAPVNTPADIYNDRHFHERGFWVEIDHPATGPVTYPGAPIDMGEGGFTVRRPAPMLGQHNEEVLSALGYAKEEQAKLREAGVI